MFSHAHPNLAEPTSHGFGRVGGYTLIFVIAVLLFFALMTNPVLP